jgi:hypothetical protein
MDKSISKGEIGSIGQNTDFIITNDLKAKEYSRMIEYEADSLGYELFRKTNYNTAEASRAIAQLDTIDNCIFTDFYSYKTRFDDPQLKFDSTWLITDFSNSWSIETSDEDKKFIDSASTHPLAKDRCKRLNELTKKRNDVALNNLQSPPILKDVKDNCIADLAYSYLISQAIASSLWYTLNLLKTYPESSYLKTMLSLNMNALLMSKQENTLETTVPFASPDYYDWINQLVSFLHNIDDNNVEFYRKKLYYTNATYKNELSELNEIMQEYYNQNYTRSELLSNLFIKKYRINSLRKAAIYINKESKKKLKTQKNKI